MIYYSTLGIQVPSQKVLGPSKRIHSGVSNHLLRRYDRIPRVIKLTRNNRIFRSEFSVAMGPPGHQRPGLRADRRLLSQVVNRCRVLVLLE